MRARGREPVAHQLAHGGFHARYAHAWIYLVRVRGSRDSRKRLRHRRGGVPHKLKVRRARVLRSAPFLLHDAAQGKLIGTNRVQRNERAVSTLARSERFVQDHHDADVYTRTGTS